MTNQGTARHHGWHWWDGPGNDRHVEGHRPTFHSHWLVKCWTEKGVGYASSACWVKPLTQSEMTETGTWGIEVKPGDLEKTREHVVKLRAALNRIAHPETWGVNPGFESEIARRALVIGEAVDELPPGAEKPPNKH